MAKPKNFAICVDAGYLHKCACRYLESTGKLSRQRAKKRASTKLDYQELPQKLIQESRDQIRGGDLLRIYWYDASLDRVPNEHHKELGRRPNVKIRLGLLKWNRAKQIYHQKGVDALVVRDLIFLALDQAVTDVVLVSGDLDIVEGVTEAQARGVRLHLMGFNLPPRFGGHGVSPELQHEADATRFVDPSFFEGIAEPRPELPSFPPIGETHQAKIVHVEGKPAYRAIADCGLAQWLVDPSNLQPGTEWNQLHDQANILFEIQRHPQFDDDGLPTTRGLTRNVRLSIADETASVAPTVSETYDDFDETFDISD